MRIFFDTNVFLDILFNRQPFATASREAVSGAIEKRYEGAISALTIVNAVYISKKYGLSQSEAKNKIASLCQYLTVLDLKGSYATECLKTTWDDYEDCIQYTSAEHYSCDIIITRNPKDFANAKIRVLPPDAFLFDQ